MTRSWTPKERLPSDADSNLTAGPAPKSKSDAPFFAVFAVLSGIYAVLLLAALVADAAFVSPWEIIAALDDPEILSSIRLSLISCSITTILSLLVAVPTGYLLSRTHFWGKSLLDSLLDIPIVLPPLVVGVSLLILFRYPPFRWISH